MTLTLFQEPIQHKGCEGQIIIELESSIVDNESIGNIRIYCEGCDYNEESKESK